MRNVIRILCIFLIIMPILLLQGCALTDENISFNYHPNLSPIKKVNTPQEIAVGKFTDQRSGNPRLLAHKTNLNEQQASGRYLADRPLASMIRNGVISALKHAGYHVNKKSKYMLKASIVEAKPNWQIGWFHSTLYYNIQMDVMLINTANNQQVWDEIYNGSGKFYTGEKATDVYAVAFTRAANNLIKNLVNSSEFRQAISLKGVASKKEKS